MNRSILAAAACAALLWAATTSAATDEEKCYAGRAKAWSTYGVCLQKLLSKAPFPTVLDSVAVEKCRAKYVGAWAKLNKLTDSTSCTGNRFADNGTTFTDRLSTLTWDKKTTGVDGNANLADPTDIDNGYALDFAHSDDGSAYSDFLAKLNSYPGLANALGWRLPTLAELLSISRDALPGATLPYLHVSTTIYQADPGQAWNVVFGDMGTVQARPKWGAASFRAVRGGL